MTDGEDPEPTQEEEGGHREAVLLVDDEKDILTSLRNLIEVSLSDVDVLEAESGEDALEVLENHSVDLIISDFKMPGMSGIDLLEKAREMMPGVPRILITAFPDLNVAIRAINEAAIESFVTKPFQPERVVEVIRKVLRERRAREHRERSFARSLELLRRRLQSESS